VVAYRDVTIIDASEPKRLDIRVQVPIEDMARVGDDIRSGPAAQGARAPSIWAAIHPRLLDLIQSHRSTLIFVNSRRLAERLAGALNELAGHPLVRAHHGSLARPQRVEIEDLLKAGHLRGLIATSSLELGIDMGAIDLVVQIEAPPSVASGLQRIGRAGHQIDAVSQGIIFPKFRGDLVACAAVTSAMRKGHVESSRFPRNPLDVLAQQLVAMTSMDRWSVDDLLATVRSAAPFAELGRTAFEGVLDMLSGRYPSDEFAELRPRITWDRVNGVVTARQGAKRVAIANAGTIPDRGLYGVFLQGADRDHARVGELDEEMVFEARVGETFVLGASTWRIEQITHDRVLVSPAPGQPGKMPFWKGEGPGRPVELGFAIGKLVRELRRSPQDEAVATLQRDHGLDARAAENLLQYLDDQKTATDAVPDDRTLVIEKSRDELGDWRVSVLSPLGSRVHAPWAMAAAARIRDERGLDVEVLWGDEGFVVRYPEGEAPPDTSLLIPDPDEVEHLVVRQLGSTALFAARFREAAGRALLLPRRRPGARAPLWQQRKRAADLLAVAARYGSFPMILETYRECLRDIFDLPALIEILAGIRSRALRVAIVDVAKPSPFAASLLFGYVANYIYDGDAPLAERRAHALSVDQSQLRDLIGDAELRDLLDARAIEALEADLQHVPERFHARSADAVHDLLLRLGDLSRVELDTRTTPGLLSGALSELVADRRAIEIRVAGEKRVIAVEDAARYRDALGVPMPLGLPAALLEPVAEPVHDLIRRYARTHGPFHSAEVALRFGLSMVSVESSLAHLRSKGRVIDGEFRPGERGREWCDEDVLRQIRRRSLARLRQEVEPVDAHALGRFLVSWHGLSRPRGGLDSLLDAVEHLQGVPLVGSILEREILPARIADYSPAMLDTLLGAGEIVWVGVAPLGERDGRIALYLTDHLSQLRTPVALQGRSDGLLERESRIVGRLSAHGASFFAAIHEAAGGGFPRETVDALWALVWKGLITNDTLHALRAYLSPPERSRRAARAAFRSRRLIPPSAEGRWSVLASPPSNPTTWATSMAQQLLLRHGVVTRDLTNIEQLPGGFSTFYPVFRRLEDTGRVRRGYFVAGLGAAQFAQPGAVDRLRSSREPSEEQTVVTISATDPANPYGALVPWPEGPETEEGNRHPPSRGEEHTRFGGARTANVGTHATDGKQTVARGATRTAGARVVLADGRMACWIARGNRALVIALPEDEPDRSQIGRALARELVGLAHRAPEGERGWLIAEINGHPAHSVAVSQYLIEVGFTSTSQGLQLRVPKRLTKDPSSD
ncbi:MAG: Lhr family helicase, partial [Vicinamibacterales bacterium]